MTIKSGYKMRVGEKELPVRHTHKFVCEECEGHVNIDAKTMHRLYGADEGDSEWPEFCPYCGVKGVMYLDEKCKLLEVEIIDVTTRGERKVDLFNTGRINHLYDGKWEDLVPMEVGRRYRCVNNCCGNFLTNTDKNEYTLVGLDKDKAYMLWSWEKDETKTESIDRNEFYKMFELVE